MFKDILKQQKSGMEAMASSTGVIGLHLVSGPAVGFAIGYGLDYCLDTSPWFKLVFFLIGIAAGFLNVYRDSRHLVNKMNAENALSVTAKQSAGKDGGQDDKDAKKKSGNTKNDRDDDEDDDAWA